MKKWIHAENDTESCNSITSSSETNRTVLDWYSDPESYPGVDPAKFNYIPKIDWDIAPEDVECLLYDPVSLDNVVAIRYVDNEVFDDLFDSGFEGGYVFTYTNGTYKIFAWRPYPNNLSPLVEVKE